MTKHHEFRAEESCSGRLDVLIHAEEVGRIVLLLDRGQPWEVGPKGSLDDVVGFLVQSAQKVGAGGKRS